MRFTRFSSHFYCRRNSGKVIGGEDIRTFSQGDLNHMKIGYARVSTEDQNLDLQLVALKNYGCDVIRSDQGISGSRFDRPGLQMTLERLERGDTLVVWRLDRLGRSLRHLVDVVNHLGQRGIGLVSLTESIETKSSTGVLMFHMIAALAEFERALISERTKAGLAAARGRGVKLGRPRIMDSDSATVQTDSPVSVEMFSLGCQQPRHLDYQVAFHRCGQLNGRDSLCHGMYDVSNSDAFGYRHLSKRSKWRLNSYRNGGTPLWRVHDDLTPSAYSKIYRNR